MTLFDSLRYPVTDTSVFNDRFLEDIPYAIYEKWHIRCVNWAAARGVIHREIDLTRGYSTYLRLTCHDLEIVTTMSYWAAIELFTRFLKEEIYRYEPNECV